MAISNSGFPLAAALALTVAAAQAEDLHSANYMLPACQAFVTGMEYGAAGICGGRVSGIVFMGGLISGTLSTSIPPSEASSQLAGLLRIGMCINTPNGVTVAQAARVVVAYIEARPARMHEPFEFLALEALRTAWPCK
jgi:hypothetical protein